jgi:protease-4
MKKNNSLKYAGIVFIVLFVISLLIAIFSKGKDSSGIISQKGIKIIYIKGAIFSESRSPFSKQDKIEELLDEIEDAEENKNILGVVVRINSPGGSVGAVQELYSALLKLRRKKPLVVSIEDIALSGGYYIASLGKPIFANKGSIVGSIGVIVISFNAKNLLNNIGIKVRIIKSGKHKDMLFWGKEITDEEKKIVKDIVTKAHKQFIEDVAKARGISTQKLMQYSDGRIILSEDALKIGLVDKIGNLKDAINYLWKVLLKQQGKPIIIKEKQSPIEKVLENLFISSRENISIKSITSPLILYLYIK